MESFTGQRSPSRGRLEWLKQHKKLKVTLLVPAAIAGLDRLMDVEAEMHWLWRENKKLYPKWKKGILELKGRLEKSAEGSAKSGKAK